MVCRPVAGHRLGDLFRRSTSARSRGARSRTSTSPTGTSWRSSWSSRSCTSSTTSPSRCRWGTPRATRSGRACRTPWCSGGTATTPSRSSSRPASSACCTTTCRSAQRPIFSYRLSILSFWGITFFYMWAGSHHLHYTALPHWVQNLGMTFSVMLLVPSWASAGNALLTLNGAWHKVRDDATLRFMMVGGGLLRAIARSKVRSWRSARSTRCRTTPTGPSATSMPARSAGWRSSPSARSTRWCRRSGSASGCIRPRWSRCTSGSRSRGPSSTSSRCGTPASSRA